ncbi:MAG: RNA polymerase sigma factor [Chloroflexota bacterium]|nr:RNA polymerase sigma factor [Chloroflexota bacterium]
MAHTAPQLDDVETLRGQAAFADFYDRALPRIHGYFYHRCDPAIAEELTQETFLAAVAVLKSGQVIHAPLAWLFGIARHKLIDHYRRQARLRQRAIISWDAWRDAGGAEPDLAAAAWEEPGWRDRTLAALAALPAAQRQAMVLRYLDDYPVLKIASALGRSTRAVESLLARGRAGFKRAYTEARTDDDA